MNLSLDNIDLDSNPYAGTGEDLNKTLRVLAIEAIVARQQPRPELAQIARDMRRAVGVNGFHPELRKAVQTFIQFTVESVGGRPSVRAFFQEAKDLILDASSPQNDQETADEATERRNVAVAKARIARAAAMIISSLEADYWEGMGNVGTLTHEGRSMAILGPFTHCAH